MNSILKKHLAVFVSVQLVSLLVLLVPYGEGVERISSLKIVFSMGIFIYLTFINGWLLMGLLFPNYSNTLRKIIYSVPLSLLVDMLVGFTVAFGFHILGISHPFNPSLLVKVFLVVSTVLNVGVFLRNVHNSFASFTRSPLIVSREDLVLMLVSLLSVIWSSIGALIFKGTGNGNIIALAWCFLVLVVVLVVFIKPSNEYVYPILVLNVSLSLTLPMLLGTSVIMGTDGYSEVYISKLVLNTGFWDNNIVFYPKGTFTAIGLYQLYNTLSDSILIPVYAMFLNVDVTFIAKEITPLILSTIFPLALYVLYRNVLKPKEAFFSTLFVLFFEFYYYNLMLGGGRQQIVEVFLVVLLLALVEFYPYSASSRFLILLLSLGLVISHYGTSSYYLVVFGIALLILYAYGNSKPTLVSSLKHTFLFVLVFFVAWNAFVYPSPTGTFKVIVSLAVATAEAILRGTRFHGGASAHVPNRMIAPKIEMGIYLMLYLLAVIGSLRVFALRNKYSDEEKLFFSISIGALLTYTLLYPLGTANAMSSWRSAHLSMICFSPLIILGLHSVTERFRLLKINNLRDVSVASLLALMLIFGSAMGYAVFNEHPDSIRAIFFYQSQADVNPRLAVALYSVYPQSSDIISTLWLSKYRDKSLPVYGCGFYKRGVLWGYGGISFDYRVFATPNVLKYRGYLYMGYLNWRKGLYCNGLLLGELLKYIRYNTTGIIYNSGYDGVILNVAGGE